MLILSDIKKCILITTSLADNQTWALKLVRHKSEFSFDILGCLSGRGQIYLLLGLIYSFARCIFGYALRTEFMARVAHINRFPVILNSLAIKILLVLYLQAIWNKNVMTWQNSQVNININIILF